MSSPTPASTQTATELAHESVTLADINNGFSASNTTAEVLVRAYISENISDQHVSEIYTVFDDVLENGTELSEQITTAEGEIRDEYIQDEYRTNGSSTEITQGTNVTDILDVDRIIADIDDENRQSTNLQQDIARVEEWYEGEYAEEIATELAEERLNASVTNVSVNGGGRSFSIRGTFYDGTEEFQSQIQIRYNTIREAKRNFTAVLETLENVRTVNRTQDGNRTVDLTERFFSELEAGNFQAVQDARHIGQAYKTVKAPSSASNSTTNGAEKSVLEGYLRDRITTRELAYLDQVREENTTHLVRATADPLSNDWSGDGVDNIALLDLGMSPLQTHDLLNEYRITRTDTGDGATANTYRIQKTGEGSGFNSTVDTDALSTVGPALQRVAEAFENPARADGTFLLYDDIDRRGQLAEVTEFAFKYLQNGSHSDTVTDLVSLAVIDDRDTGVYGPGLAEKIAFFNTFDESWDDRDVAFQFARLLVDEQNLEYAEEEGLHLRDPVYQQATEDGSFTGEHTERLTEERLEQLKEEVAGIGEPDIEPAEIDELNDYGGGDSTNRDGPGDDDENISGGPGDDGTSSSDDGDGKDTDKTF